MFTCDIIDDAFVIETERLALRWPRLADARAIEQLAGDKDVAEMTARIPHPYPPGAGERFILSARQSNSAGRGLTLIVANRRAPGELIGAISVSSDEGTEPEVGYWIGKPYWGRGFATEALRGLVDTVFERSEITSITAGVRVVNPISRRVLEKCGFRHDRAGFIDYPARGGLVPVDHLRLDRRTWASLKQWLNPHYASVRDRTAEPSATAIGAEPC